MSKHEVGLQTHLHCEKFCHDPCRGRAQRVSTLKRSKIDVSRVSQVHLLTNSFLIHVLYSSYSVVYIRSPKLSFAFEHIDRTFYVVLKIASRVLDKMCAL